MLDLEQIREKLKDRNISVISRATGVRRQSIADVKNGEAKNPNYETLKKLSDYFEEQP